MVRAIMTMVMVIGAYVAGMNEVTHVEVIEYSEIAISYVDRVIDAVSNVDIEGVL